jgi:hypothetical protein
MISNDQRDALLRTELNSQTSLISWQELLRFFATGTVIRVADDLDLVEVALQVVRDNKDTIARWMEEGKIRQVSDMQAKEWLEAEASLWSVVVKPWILVQQNKPVATA